MEYIKIGQITKPFGLKGDVKVYPYTGFIDERFAKNNTVYLKVDNEYLPVIIEKANLHKGLVNVKFKEYNHINDIEKYSRTDIYFDKSKLHKLANGEYYIFELVGLKAYDQNNTYLGDVIEVVEGIAHNNLKISHEPKPFLIPNIKQFVKKVDLENKTIHLELIEGII